ncbi:MAG: RNA polymerase subunit sigma-70 [Burkholderiales bacterium]|nr:MAG: RNA polymerase subunit sigma-70 [Burkholderiales bacterium]
MNISQHPELLDMLAARYAVGIMRAGARRRFEFYSRQSATVRARILLWQERLHAIMELPSPVQPSPNVWKRIENSLSALPHRIVMASPVLQQLQDSLARLHKQLSWWRAGAAFAGIAAVAGTLFSLQTSQSYEGRGQQIAQLQKQLQQQAAQQQVQYVAVLADEKSDASVLVTFDPDKKRLVLQRVGGYQEAADKSLQLWALPPGQAPQSLGVMGNDKVLKLTAAPDQIKNVPTLAISLEPKGGVPSSGGPTGPVLFKGALLQTVL